MAVTRKVPYVLIQCLLGTAAIACALVFAATAPAATPVVLDPSGESVAAYGGWAAWSRVDASTHEFALVLRSPQGAISLAPVPESAAPFDVELGPSGGGVAAVYSRCTNNVTVQGCHVVELGLDVPGAGERTLTPPIAGSLHEPAIWNGTIVFLRRIHPAGAHKPDSLISWRTGTGKVRSLALPSSRGGREAGGGRWPKGLTGLISGLTFNGKQVGYVTSNLNGTFGETTLWFEPLGGHPELIDQETSGAGNVCQPAFLSPALSGRWLYAYLHACAPSANPRLDRLTRYRRGEVQRASFTFVRVGDEEVSSVVPDGTGVDWDADGIENMATVNWQKIKPPVAETFCSRADPFC